MRPFALDLSTSHFQLCSQDHFINLPHNDPSGLNLWSLLEYQPGAPTPTRLAILPEVISPQRGYMCVEHLTMERVSPTFCDPEPILSPFAGLAVETRFWDNIITANFQ
ncbi:hypothetical protein Pdw03_6739 [Penicillium digitatum]|uniref:Uncharacterized protein n=1 Tax=Penicillium digitatum TaxID=36651 RepID=A0A7T6XKI5_PENDI|nr:hypothetical protein Pdw03_6739 [Penicillium digitatum]